MEYTFEPLPVLVTDRAAATPRETAIESISTGEQITWQELDRSCRRWADAVRRLGVEPGETVVTLMPNTPDAFSAWLGIAWLRAIEVSVNGDYRGEWLTHSVNTARARVVVTSSRFLPFLAAVADELEHVETVVVYDADEDDAGDGWLAPGGSVRVVLGAELFAGAEPAEGLATPQVWDPMGVIYTSGTTGPAKGVVLPWGVQEAERLIFAGPEFSGSTFYGTWPPFHTLGKSQLFVPTAFGGKLVLRERFSIGEFWNDVRTYGCTTAYVVSVIANFLYRQPERDDDADNPLEAVIMGPVIPEVDDFKRRFGVNVYTTFGSTEVGAVYFSFMRDVDGSNWKSVGRAVPDAPCEAAIVDEHDLPVGPGVPGELVVRPKVPWVLNQGYLNMAEATARAWRNGWFHTGDTFVYDEDGEHYFVDRDKDYIRRRGENISSFDVEHAVCSFPAVTQAAAVAVPSEVGEDEVMVFVQCEATTSFDPAELVRFLADRVPKFALPRFIEVVDAMPTTQATFRIQKHKLRERGPSPNAYDRLATEG